jgi:hypothetical protein
MVVLPKVLSSTSGLGDLEDIGAMQLRLMRMKKRVGAVTMARPENLTHSEDQQVMLNKDSKRSKDGSLKGGSRRKESMENTIRSKSSKKESKNNLPQVSARHKREPERTMVASNSRLLEPTLAMELRKL